MFTGIVEETGVIEAISPAAGSIRLAVRSNICAADAKPGDSIAVNGCCLTVVSAGAGAASEGKLLQFDLLQETWRRTNLQFCQAGSLVNLERSLRADGRFGGHFVTGHIDGTGTILKWEQSGKDWELEIAAPGELLRYLVFKGAIAVDGISLTVAEVLDRGMRIWIIPHTYAVTNLRGKKAGDAVNLEADILAKYLDRFMEARGAQSSFGFKAKSQ